MRAQSRSFQTRGPWRRRLFPSRRRVSKCSPVEKLSKANPSCSQVPVKHSLWARDHCRTLKCKPLEDSLPATTGSQIQRKTPPSSSLFNCTRFWGSKPAIIPKIRAKKKSHKPVFKRRPNRPELDTSASGYCRISFPVGQARPLSSSPQPQQPRTLLLLLLLLLSTVFWSWKQKPQPPSTKNNWIKVHQKPES